MELPDNVVFWKIWGPSLNIPVSTPNKPARSLAKFWGTTFVRQNIICIPSAYVSSLPRTFDMVHSKEIEFAKQIAEQRENSDSTVLHDN